MLAVQHLVCLDTETMELRRYEKLTGQRVRVTHGGCFQPTGDHARETEAVEFVRKFPATIELAHRLAAQPDPYAGEPEDILWMTPPIDGFF